MDITNYTDEQKKTFQNSLDTGALPTIASQTISSSSLSGGTSPVILPQITPNTKADALIASSQQSQVDAEKQAEANMRMQEKAIGVGAAQEQKNSTLDYIKGLFGKESQAYTDVNALPEKQQLVDEQKSLTDINKEIADQNVKLRGEADAIMGNGGISKEGQISLLQNVKDNYGRRLADLAIRQSAASGNVTRLQSSLKDALAMKIAPLEQEIAYYKDFGIKNLEDLDKKEQDTLTRLIAEKKAIVDKETSDHKVFNDYLTEASKNDVKVPDAAIVEAQKDPANTPQIFAKYGITLANPADQAKKYAEAAKIRAEANGSGGVTIKKVDANGNPIPPGPEEQALSVILGSGKFTKDQVKLVTNSINNGEDPFTVIKNQAKNIMGQTEATTVTKYETAQSALTDLQNALSQFYANGGKTNIFAGNYEKVINKLGAVNDPKLVDLATQIQAQLQVYRNAVSGTAYSAQEGADINTIFPGINKTQGLNEAILKGRMKAFDSTIDGAYKATLGSSYDKLKEGKMQSQTTTTTQSGQPFDTAAAKASGYTDQEIYDYLKTH